jgi:hypothetical protein
MIILKRDNYSALNLFLFLNTDINKQYLYNEINIHLVFLHQTCLSYFKLLFLLYSIHLINCVMFKFSSIL